MQPIQKISTKICIFFACIIFLNACNKSDLNLAPKTQISDAQFFNTASDLQVFCNSFYQQLPSFAANSGAGSFSVDVPGIGSNSGVVNVGIYGVDDNSDNMVTGSYNTFLNGQSTLPPSGAGWATGNWSTIRNTNYFLANYTRVKDLRVNVAPYVGEAYFFKAWFYYDKLRVFGAVPWLSTPTTISDTAQLFSSRLPRNVIADSINRCLDSAIANLPVKSRALANRVYKEFAQAFRARVCLYEGTWEKYHQGDPFGVAGNNGAKYLQMAADTAQAIINSGVFALDSAAGSPTAYFNLFNRSDYTSSKEVMLWRKYDGSQGIYNFWSAYIASGPNRGITKGLVDAYLCIDGKPIGASSLYKGDDSLSWVITNRDPRLKQTIYTPGAIQYTNNPGVVLWTIPPFTGSGSTFCPTGYQLDKGHSTDIALNNAGAPGSTQGLIYMRYAEVLLILAESKAELGTITQADINATVNKLRTRAGMPAAAALNIASITTDPNWDFPSLSPVINEIRRERRVELACEGYRFDDIMRWAAAGTYFVNWKPKGAKWNQWNTLFSAAVNAKFKRDANGYIEPFQTTLPTGYKFNVGRDYLEPIPQDQLLIAGYTQNPGW